MNVSIPKEELTKLYLAVLADFSRGQKEDIWKTLTYLLIEVKENTESVHFINIVMRINEMCLKPLDQKTRQMCDEIIELIKNKLVLPKKQQLNLQQKV